MREQLQAVIGEDSGLLLMGDLFTPDKVLLLL